MFKLTVLGRTPCTDQEYIRPKRLNVKVKCVMEVKYDSTMSCLMPLEYVRLWGGQTPCNSALVWRGSSPHHQQALHTRSHPVGAENALPVCLESTLLSCTSSANASGASCRVRLPLRPEPPR